MSTHVMLNTQQIASDQSASQMFYAHWHDLKFSSKSQLISLVLSVVRVVGSILFSAGDSDGISASCKQITSPVEHFQSDSAFSIPPKSWPCRYSDAFFVLLLSFLPLREGTECAGM